MALTPDEQRRVDETNAALARSQSFTDGRRRVVPTRDQTITLGHGMLTFSANEIIQDVYRIALMEQHGIEFVELNVNDRSKRPKADESKGEAVVRTDNVNALADALDVDRDVVRDALFGKQPQIDRAAAVIYARGEGTKLQRATDAAKVQKLSENFKTYRTMVESRVALLAKTLGIADLTDDLLDGLTGDPKIVMDDLAQELATRVVAAFAEPTTKPEVTGDEQEPAPPDAAAGTEADFEPGTPAV